MAVLVFDIGGTKTAYAKVNTYDDIEDFNMIETRAIYNNIEGFLINIINRFLSKNSDIEGVAIGIPGTVDYIDNKIISCPNVSVLDGLNLSKLIGEKVGIPLIVSRDVNFSILAEHIKGSAKDVMNALGIFVGTGLGASILINGEIFLGSHGVAAELGHIFYPRGENKVCQCGNIDCVELYASGKSLKEKSDLFRNKFNKKIFEKDYFIYKDTEWQKEIYSFIEALSFSISTFVNLIDPEAVVIGGGVSKAKGFPWEVIINKTKEKLRKPLPYRKVSFREAKMDYKESLIGGYSFFHQILKNQ
jgi:predicted NBD/HSP70 family sugar kinase